MTETISDPERDRSGDTGAAEMVPPNCNPILHPSPRQHASDVYTLHDVQLANRNSGIHLEALRHEVTPIGMHYLLSHFDVPYVESARQWSLEVGGLVDSPLKLSIADLQALPIVTRQVTLECSGNGRALLEPRWQSMPWMTEAVGNAEWTGTSLANVLAKVGVQPGAVEWVFSGADLGVDSGKPHYFERSLTTEMATHPDVMLVWSINGQLLPPQHGYPLRLLVPGWYGMASVKWLRRIEAIDHPFAGYQQAGTYRFRQNSSDDGVPITLMRVRSLMVPPGIPDWYTRKRLLVAGTVVLCGRAWSGAGVPVQRVDVAVNGEWQEAELIGTKEKYGWSSWQFVWQATAGRHELSSRATDANGAVQPLEPPWDYGGFGNNAVQNIVVWVEDELPELST